MDLLHLCNIKKLKFTPQFNHTCLRTIFNPKPIVRINFD
jgi:hypothetical protein